MLSEGDRRLLAAWAADCAESVLPLFETHVPADDRPRSGVRPGELSTAEETGCRFVGGACY